jgi:hypothetical protein
MPSPFIIILFYYIVIVLYIGMCFSVEGFFLHYIYHYYKLELNVIVKKSKEQY